MLSFLLALGLLGVALVAIGLRKAYYSVPARELKRQARAGDPAAKVLYRAVAYGSSLGLLLWVIVVISLAASFVLLDQITPALFAFILEAVVIGLGFAWMPNSDLTKTGARLGVWATPVVVWLLEFLHPAFDRVNVFVRQHRSVTLHTGLYEHEDLLHLLQRQKDQPDSRISHDEIGLLEHTLTFAGKTVYECMVPRREVRTISADEQVGPVVIRELHDSGHARFPVYDGKKDNIVGTLYLRDLINLKKTGKVSGIMEHKVFYVHEEYPLEQALHAFLKTKHHLFVVVNRFEEFVGIITIEDILEQILGCKIVDEFDAYENLRAVAADHARHDHHAHQKDGEEPLEPEPEPAQDHEKISEEATEVIQ
jgi:CBS domain containing-hemolysin-like protein